MRALIICGGEQCSLPLLKSEISRSDFVIAADAGIEIFRKIDQKPNLIVGDFDSAKQETLKNLQESGIATLRAKPEKDDTDTMLAARCALSHGAKKITLLCATGGRLDHTYANFQVLAYAFHHGAAAKIIDDHQEIIFASGAYTLSGAAGQTFSILSYGGDACVSILEGKAKYPLCALTLPCDFPIGTSNILISDTLCLSIEGEVLIFRNK